MASSFPAGFVSPTSDCYGCGQPTQYIQSYMRAGHWVSGHWKHATVDSSTCSGVMMQESAEHKRAKEILYNCLHTGFPLKFASVCSSCKCAYMVCLPTGEGKAKQEAYHRGTEAKVSYFDVARLDPAGKPIFGIEVLFKHRTHNEEGRAGVPWVEVDAVAVIQAKDAGTLAKPLTNIRLTNTCPDQTACLSRMSEALRLDEELVAQAKEKFAKEWADRMYREAQQQAKRLEEVKEAKEKERLRQVEAKGRADEWAAIDARLDELSRKEAKATADAKKEALAKEKAAFEAMDLPRRQALQAKMAEEERVRRVEAERVRRVEAEAERVRLIELERLREVEQAKRIEEAKRVEEEKRVAAIAAEAKREQRALSMAEREAKAKVVKATRAAATRKTNAEMKARDRQITMLRSVYLSHGLTAELAALPTSTPEWLAAEMKYWFPNSPT
jgi:hypothetical protein